MAMENPQIRESGDRRDDAVSPVGLVTGAAGAIGSAYVRGLAGAGFRLVLADIVDASDRAEEIREGGGEAIAVRVDVSDVDSVAEMAASAMRTFGRIDLLVNNAAFFSDITKMPAEEISVADWDRAFVVNVRGAWLCACAVLPTMKSQGSGKIVNTSSMTFHGGGIDGFAHYASSKAAIVGLTRCLAREWGDYGIRVNTISPDYVAHEGRLFEEQPDMEQRLAQQRAIKRPGTADDLVGTLLFLAGESSGFITGQDFWVNGGRIFG